MDVGPALTPMLREFRRQRTFGNYELSITSEDVPLSLGLALLIVDSDGKELRRLSGRPDAR